jgi:hypothetical protein
VTGTLTTSLRLHGDELEDARQVALLGVMERAGIWRGGLPGGGCGAAEADDLPGLVAAVDVAERLGVGFGRMSHDPLDRRDATALRWAAEDLIDRQKQTDGCDGDQAMYLASNAELARRVLRTVERMEAVLPPVEACACCGQEVTS